MSETSIDFRQQLSTSSFEACEKDITVNYFSVYTWTENFSFMGNLTSWPMPFWLVILIEHKVLHCYATNRWPVLRMYLVDALYAPPTHTSWLLFSKLSMFPSFQPLSSISLNSLRACKLSFKLYWLHLTVRAVLLLCTSYIAHFLYCVLVALVNLLLKKMMKWWCTILLWQIEIFNHNYTFLWHFHDFV